MNHDKVMVKEKSDLEHDVGHKLPPKELLPICPPSVSNYRLDRLVTEQLNHLSLGKLCEEVFGFSTVRVVKERNVEEPRRNLHIGLAGSIAISGYCIKKTFLNHRSLGPRTCLASF